MVQANYVFSCEAGGFQTACLYCHVRWLGTGEIEFALAGVVIFQKQVVRGPSFFRSKALL
jgi:hypothetical protein